MLDDARGDVAALAALQAELQQARESMRAALTRLLDEERDYATAGLKVREWMFVEKLAQELAHAQPAG
jgi:molecular chaperone HscB